MSPSQLDQLELRTGHHLLAGPGLRLGDGTQVGGGSWGPYKSCPHVGLHVGLGAGAVPAAQQLHGAPWRPHAELQGRRLVPALAPVQAHLPTLRRWDTVPLSSIPRYYP